MNAGRTFTNKRNRFLTLGLALFLALTMLVGQNSWGRLINVTPAVAYACQGPSGSC